MGRRLSRMNCGGFDFGIGITFALFQITGTDPLLKDALKMWRTGSAIAKANSFRNQFSISSVSGELCVLTCDNKLYTSSGWKKNIRSGYQCLLRSIDTCSNALLLRYQWLLALIQQRSIDTCSNALLIRSRSNWTSTSDVVETSILRPRRGKTFGLRDRGKARHFKNLTRDCLEVNQSQSLRDTLLYYNTIIMIINWEYWVLAC